MASVKSWVRRAACWIPDKQSCKDVLGVQAAFQLSSLLDRVPEPDQLKVMFNMEIYRSGNATVLVKAGF